MKKLVALLSAAALMPTLALADSITPDMFETTITVGQVVYLDKIVTVNAGRPTTSLVDVFFLADVTGSMGSAIASVETSASDILTSTSGLGDVQYGVGQYRDIFDGSGPYNLLQDITGNTANVQTAINSWFASGGGDTPEANINALEQMAEGTSWRAGSKRIAVWFGDATGHDPRNGSTEASATAALVDEGIVVQALNVGIGGLDGTGQATRITDATGGTLFNGIASGAVGAAIQAAIDEAFVNYNKIELEVWGLVPGVDIAFVPTSHVGAFDRSIERTFPFTVAFTGLLPGDWHFEIHALVDGAIVATEKDWIHVVGGHPVPEPSTWILLGTGLVGMVGVARRKRA